MLCMIIAWWLLRTHHFRTGFLELGPRTDSGQGHSMLRDIYNVYKNPGQQHPSPGCDSRTISTSPYMAKYPPGTNPLPPTPVENHHSRRKLQHLTRLPEATTLLLFLKTQRTFALGWVWDRMHTHDIFKRVKQKKRTRRRNSNEGMIDIWSPEPVLLKTATVRVCGSRRRPDSSLEPKEDTGSKLRNSEYG